MTTTPTIQPDDGSVLTPDIPPDSLLPHAGATGTEAKARLPDVRRVSLVGLFVLAVLFTLHLAQDFFLPIVLAVLFDFLLSPLVRWLRKVGIPEPIGAGGVMLVLLGALTTGAWYLSGPASQWLARAPESMATVERRLQTLRRPVEQVTKAAQTVEAATEVGPEERRRSRAVLNMVILGLAALLAFESTTQALLVPLVFLAINIIEGNLVTPMILGSRMRLNTVALFIGLIFWFYVWGIPGAIIAVPMMAALKIVCDHIESLAPVGEFLET